MDVGGTVGFVGKTKSFLNGPGLPGASLSSVSDHATRASQGVKHIWIGPMACFLTLLACTSLFGLNTERSIGQFVHTGWSAKDGAPSDVWALAQTTDGFLWLGTAHGLYRFDGLTFERYQPQSGPAFQSSHISSLLALPNGDLWIGFRGKGVSRLRSGRNTNYTNSDGLPSGSVPKLVQDRDGTIWAGTDEGLARFDHDQWQSVGNDWGYPGGRVTTLFVDPHGTLWVAPRGKAVLFLPPGSKKLQTTGIEVTQTAQIVESPGGTLWMAETTRSVRPLMLPANRVEPEIQVGSAGILFDDDASLWITSLGDGMRRVPFPDRLNGRKIGEFSSAIESFTAKDGLTSDFVTCILKDREGSIWVGTSAGLDRFRRGALVPILLPTKFAQKALVAGDNGDIWVGSGTNSFARIEGNTLKISPNWNFRYGLRDSRGTIWFLDYFHRVLRVEQGRLTTFAKAAAGIQDWLGTVLAIDRSGTPWVGNGLRSLFFLKNGHWERFETPPAVAGIQARVTFTDANGRVWFGFSNNSILVLDEPNVRTFSAKDGLEVGLVMAITGRDRHIWIGGEGGLFVWEGDRFRTVVPAGSDAFHGVSGVQEDSAGDLFLSEQRGVLFIPGTEVSKILKNPSARVHYQTFDVHDGLPGAIQQTGAYPTAVQGTDGRLWFSTSSGVAWIDPAHIPRNTLPPPIAIRSITANGTRYTSLDGLRLPPRTRDLTIDYTALSLAVPERVHFRYKLEDSDTQWHEAGTRREAFYTNLRPASYRFRVIACNNDGVWNERGAALDFTIIPTWYQTNWFIAACIITGVFVVWTLYRLRVRQVARALSVRFDERLAERTRVARELHDTLLQTVQGSKMVADDALEQPADPARQRRALEQLSGWLGQAVREERAALNLLRTSTTQQNDLSEAFRRAIEDCRRQGSLEATFSLDGHPKEMHPVVRDEVYRIGYEAIRNACAHSHGSRLNVKLIYTQDLTLCVTDNGVGIGPAIVNHGKEGHYGLLGIRERAARIGGKLSITSSQDSGTEVKLLVPGRIIFRDPTTRLFQRITAIFRGKDKGEILD